MKIIKTIWVCIALAVLCFSEISSAKDQIEIDYPKKLSEATVVSVSVKDGPKNRIVIRENGIWKDKEFLDKNKGKITTIYFEFKEKTLRHLVEVNNSKVVFVHEQLFLK